MAVCDRVRRCNSLAGVSDLLLFSAVGVDVELGTGVFVESEPSLEMSAMVIDFDQLGLQYDVFVRIDLHTNTTINFKSYCALRLVLGRSVDSDGFGRQSEEAFTGT